MFDARGLTRENRRRECLMRESGLGLIFDEGARWLLVCHVDGFSRKMRRGIKALIYAFRKTKWNL